MPCPVSVKQMEHEEDEDGITDESIKRNPDFQKWVYFICHFTKSANILHEFELGAITKVSHALDFS